MRVIYILKVGQYHLYFQTIMVRKHISAHLNKDSFIQDVEGSYTISWFHTQLLRNTELQVKEGIIFIQKPLLYKDSSSFL